jgi:hypothetical protein
MFDGPFHRLSLVGVSSGLTSGEMVSHNFQVVDPRNFGPRQNLSFAINASHVTPI